MKINADGTLARSYRYVADLAVWLIELVLLKMKVPKENIRLDDVNSQGKLSGAAPFIQVFILTYERPELLAQTLKSVLAQDYANYQVVVSDNSKSDRTAALVKRFADARLMYRQRIPSLPPLQHFNQILGEVSADYFMLFHDDDLMLPGCLSDLIRGFTGSARPVAVGGNATLLLNRFASSRKYITAGRNILIRRPDDLIRRYFTSEDYAPFPSYLYCRAAMGNLRLATDRGKHADVIFLAELCRLGPLLMLNQVVMQYRLHPAQDTSICSLDDRRSLVNWACSHSEIKRQDPEVRFYRLNGLIEKTRQRKNASKRLFFRLLLAMAILHAKFFRLQFFFLFIRLAQRIIQSWVMRQKAW